MQFFNAYCIINHRLHTGWQSWRGTKSTVAGQPRSIPDRCWWLLNQLWLPRGSCRCVCVLCVYSVWYIYVGVLNVCSSVFVMRLQDTPSVPTLFGKSPLCPSSRKCSPPSPLWLSHPQPDMKWFVSEFFRMRSFGPKRPHGCCSVYNVFDCGDAWSPRQEARNSTRIRREKDGVGLSVRKRAHKSDFIQRAQ